MTATFGDLKTQIQSEVNRPAAANLTFISNAIVAAIKFYEAKPVWFTQKKDTLTLNAGDTTIAIPDDLKGITNLRMLVNGYYRGKGKGFDPLMIYELEERYNQADLTQIPEAWALFNTLIYVNCISDDTYTLPITYNYGDTTYPSMDGDTSVWFGDGYDVIRYKAEAIFYRDRLHDYELADVSDTKADEFLNNLVERTNMRDYEYQLA